MEPSWFQFGLLLFSLVNSSSYFYGIMQKDTGLLWHGRCQCFAWRKEAHLETQKPKHLRFEQWHGLTRFTLGG